MNSPNNVEPVRKLLADSKMGYNQLPKEHRRLIREETRACAEAYARKKMEIEAQFESSTEDAKDPATATGKNSVQRDTPWLSSISNILADL
jgi:hypothetical protein